MSRWGGWENFQKKKKLSEGQGENKVPKKKQRSGLTRAEKLHRDRKENPISAPSIHVGALVGAGSFWPILYIKVIGEVTLSFTPYSVCFHSLSLFEWYLQNKEILLNLSIKC